MGDFLLGAGNSLKDVASGIYLIGAVVIAVSAAMYVIAKIRALFGSSEYRFEGGRTPEVHSFADPNDPNDERNYSSGGDSYDDDLSRYGK